MDSKFHNFICLNKFFFVNSFPLKFIVNVVSANKIILYCLETNPNQ